MRLKRLLGGLEAEGFARWRSSSCEQDRYDAEGLSARCPSLHTPWLQASENMVFSKIVGIEQGFPKTRMEVYWGHTILVHYPMYYSSVLRCDTSEAYSEPGLS